jgi:large subunit ribosomal protein L4
MPQITLKNAAGKSAGKVELDDAMFGIQPNVPVMHQVVTAQLAARRAGTQSTKTRAEVRGGGAKPYRQKGTGNARQGSIRGPHYSGGGVAHGPKPRKYGQNTPKKMIKLALRSALSDRASEGRVVVVSDWGWDKPNTKAAKSALAGLGVDGLVLVVVGRDDAAAALSFRNLQEVQVIAPGELNAYDVLCNDWLIFTESTLPVDAPKVPKNSSAPAAASTLVAAADTAVDTAVDTEAESEFAGAVKALADGSQPEGYDIKGNADSMLYHTPGSRFYKRTVAEVWFATEEDAEAAGFSKPASQQAAEDAATDESDETTGEES